MLPEFVPAYWESRFRCPDWYVQLEPELQKQIFPIVHDDAGLSAWRHQIYQLAGEMLERGEIPLAASGQNLDEERKLPDTLVLHHTEIDPYISLAELNAIGFIRQYG